MSSLGRAMGPLTAVLLLAAVEACSSSSEGERTSDAGTGTPDAGRKVTFSTTAVDFPNVQTVLSGVNVCIHPGLTECATTDQNGRVSILVPADSEVALSFDGTSTGHTKLLLTLTTTTNDLGPPTLAIASTATSQSVAQAAGFVADATKAVVLGEAASPTGPASGVTFSLSPASGTGPVYFGANALPDPQQAATTVAGFGLGVFGAVTPQEYELTFAGKVCTPIFAWKGSGAGAARVPAVAGYLTLATMSCQ